MTVTNSWTATCIAVVCESIVDCLNRTAPVIDETTAYKMIRTTNVRDGWVDLTTVRYVDEATYQKWTRRQIPKRGDIILTREAPLGEVGMLRTSDQVFLGQRLVSYRVDPAKADNRFLLYAFQADELQAQIKALGSGATVEHMRVPDAKLLMVSLPPLPTQRRIASILSVYDDLIENNTRRIAVLEEMARRVYEEWFVQFRFPGHEEAIYSGDLPKGWRRGPIRDLYAGLYDGPHATPKPSTEGPIFLGIGNLTESGHLDLSAVRHIAEEEFSKWTKRVTPQPGDIVFTYEATLNRYAIIPRGFHGCLGRRLALIRVDPRKSSSLFLYCSFFSSDWRTVIAQNTLSGATVDRIPLSKLPQFPVNIPPQEIIKRFDAMVRPMFDLMHALGQKNANLRAQRDLLLPKLISGEIDVSSLPLPGADDEAA